MHDHNFVLLLLLEVLAFSAAYFGQGAGPILLHVVHCNGSETSLLDCNYLNQSNCVNNAEAGVRCSGKYCILKQLSITLDVFLLTPCSKQHQLFRREFETSKWSEPV